MVAIVVRTALGEYTLVWNSTLNEFIRQYQIGGIWRLKNGKGQVVHVPWGAVLELYEY